MATVQQVATLCFSQPISRVLCPIRGACHSSIQCVTTLLKRSTLRLGRATLKRRYTWTCSLQDTRPVHRCTAGGLLPHLLTLTLAGGYFLLRYSAFTSSFLLGSGVLYAARTFLLCLYGQRRQTVRLLFSLPAKVAQCGWFTRFIFSFDKWSIWYLTYFNSKIPWYYSNIVLYSGVMLIHTTGFAFGLLVTYTGKDNVFLL